MKEGYLPVPSDELRRRFIDKMSQALDELGFPTHLPERADTEFVASSSGDLIASEASGNGAAKPHHEAWGGRRGRRSEDFNPLWEDMTSTYRAHPGARW